MKIALSIIVCLFLLSCGSNNNDQEAPTESWNLVSRKVYRYTFNTTGLPDTTFIKTYQYKDLTIVDSTEEFSVAAYKDGQLLSKRYFKKRVDSLPLSEWDIEYNYVKNQLRSIITKKQGVLQKDERYVYDTANRLSRYIYIQAMNHSQSPTMASNTAVNSSASSGKKYDTVVVAYAYDSTNKNLGAVFANSRGEVFRKDINIYSASTPLASYNLDYKGDTTQKIEYTMEGKYFRSKIENDSTIIQNWTINNVPLRQLEIRKKTNEQFKNDVTYNEGRLVEEKYYKLAKSTGN